MLFRLFAMRSGEGAHDEILHLTVVNKDNSFQFHPMKLHINQLLSIKPLGIRTGKALVIISTVCSPTSL